MQRIFKFFINFIHSVHPCLSFKYTPNPAKCFTSGIIEFRVERSSEQPRTAGGKKLCEFTERTTRARANRIIISIDLRARKAELIMAPTSEREVRNYFRD